MVQQQKGSKACSDAAAPLLEPPVGALLGALLGFSKDSPIQSQGSDLVDVCGVLMLFKTQPDLHVLKAALLFSDSLST